ncbi:hypothetical protein [Pseudonocardia sp. HH130630-07]|uniref:hypothetical protein n=1 Tax=Pseudonocardia sp. HH130630-07 TaxID=1690815 RepID=UPI000814E38B|nr:hypothetical protein [Pseudonocardia sp. HH130630-07]ANY08122.1 hypothetical protein AFB00_19570 [Pseudonocardia sp. HH130630-07]
MIGVVGATGEVGSHAVRVLRELDAGPLRLGGSADVDHRDAASLDGFAAGCRVLVNCAGPAHLIGDRVARAAVRAGAGYVDASDVDGVGTAPAAWSAVVGAGLRPGLTGLLPRWLAGREFDTVHGLVAHLAVLDRFTATAAEDYLHSRDGEPLAAWRAGRVPGALTRRTGVTVPFLPGAVSLLPHLGREEIRLAQAPGLERGDWYSAVDGEHVGAAFDRARSAEPADAVTALVRASALDLAGREPYVVSAVRLDGAAAGRPVCRTALLRGRGNGELTGAVTALAALAVDRGEVAPGVHTAAAVLDPEPAIARLTGLGIASVQVLDGDAPVEDGAL